MRREQPQKHLVYHRVLDAFRQSKGCPLCAMETEFTHRYFDYLLYENVNDPEVREKLREARGYCSRHAALLLRFSDGLGTAILYKDLVELLLKELKDRASWGPGAARRRGIEQWRLSGECPACQHQEELRGHYVSAFLEGLTEPELAAAFEGSDGLCVPHLALCLQTAKGPNTRSLLLQNSRQKYSKLSEELAEFIRKHDYRFSHEGFGEEKDSWRRAVEMLTGSEGVF